MNIIRIIVQVTKQDVKIKTTEFEYKVWSQNCKICLVGRGIIFIIITVHKLWLLICYHARHQKWNKYAVHVNVMANF